MNPHWGVLKPPPPKAIGMVVQHPPQREFILSVFHRQKKYYRPNQQTLFLILTVEAAVVMPGIHYRHFVSETWVFETLFFKR